MGVSEAAMQSSMAPCVLRQWNGVRLALEVDLMVRTKRGAMEPWAVTQQVVLTGEVAEGSQEKLQRGWGNRDVWVSCGPADGTDLTVRSH